MLGVLGAILCLPACAPIVAMIGYGNSAVQVAIQLDRVKLASDGVSFLKSGKTLTDHAVSKIAGADCHLMNVVLPGPVCKPQVTEVASTAQPRTNLAVLSDELMKRDAGATDLPRATGEASEELPVPAQEAAE